MTNCFIFFFRPKGLTIIVSFKGYSLDLLEKALASVWLVLAESSTVFPWPSWCTASAVTGPFKFWQVDVLLWDCIWGFIEANRFSSLSCSFCGQDEPRLYYSQVLSLPAEICIGAGELARQLRGPRFGFQHCHGDHMYCNSNSRGPSGLFLPPQVLGVHVVHIQTDRRNIHTHKIKQIKKASQKDVYFIDYFL